jgi:hypothetical protein
MTSKSFLFQSPKVPWLSIVKSLPFWAILMAHMGQNYGYETLMTELPSFMKQVLHFNLQDVSPNGKQPCSLRAISHSPLDLTVILLAQFI